MRTAVAVALTLAAATAHATQIEVPAGGRVDLTIDAPGGGIVSWEVNGGHSQDLPIIIDAGGAGDTGYIGGSAVDRGTIDGLPRAYQTERWGLAGYQIQVAPGSYDVVLGFVETYSGVTKPGQRTFSATVEGRPLVTGMDVLAQGCGRNKIVTRTARNVAVSGDSIDIAFSGKAAMVSVIEVRAAGTAGPDVGTGGCDWGDSGGGGGTGGGGGGNTGGPQCDASDVPAEARAAGLTRLTFCEDFSDPKRISLGTDLGAGQTFTQVRGDNIFGAKPMPASAFSFSDGAMHVRPTHNNYQVNFISTVPTGGGNFRGYALRGAGWYAQIRWKHDACGKSSGFPAFWSMEARHLYGLTRRGELMLEPDFYENIGGRYIGALHQWDFHASPRHHVLQMTSQAMPQTPTQYFVAGAMSEKGGAGYSWWFNGRRMDRKAPSWSDMFNRFTGPVMFGSGPGCNYSVDWIKVWED